MGEDRVGQLAAREVDAREVARAEFPPPQLGTRQHGVGPAAPGKDGVRRRQGGGEKTEQGGSPLSADGKES